MALSIRLATSPADIQTFLTLPRVLYAGMNGYVAPLDIDRATVLHPKKSPFFSHGEAGYFLAFRDGRPVGRISAQIDHLATGGWHEGFGQFGCLDTADDQEAVSALVAAAEAWLGERGKSAARGPFLLGINGETGLTLEGHTAPPMVLIPWHPPYLPALLESAGYRIARRIHSYDADLASWDYEKLIVSRGLDRARWGLTIRKLDLRNLARDAEIARNLFDDAWSQNYAFVPLAKAEIDLLSKEYRPFLVPENGLFVEKDGEPVAFTLALPNLFEITGDLGGSPSLAGWGKLAYRAFTHRYSHVRLALFGVSSRYRDTAMSGMIAARALGEHARIGKAYGFKRLEAGWVLEDNEPVNRLLSTFGFERTRTHAIYERHFT